MIAFWIANRQLPSIATFKSFGFGILNTNPRRGEVQFEQIRSSLLEESLVPYQALLVFG